MRSKFKRDEYRALYKEVLFILLNLCNDRKILPYNQTQDLVHLILDVFMKKRSKDTTFNIEMAVQDVLQSGGFLDAPYYDETEDVVRGQLDAQQDLDQIYIQTHQDLSIQEKYIFCTLLSEKIDKMILSGLQIVESEVEKLKESLIGKLQHAATSTAKQKSICQAYFPVGPIKRNRKLH